MGEALQRRLKQERFESPAFEAMLNVMVAADHLHQKADDVCLKFKLTFTQYNVLRILRGSAQGGLPFEEIRFRMLDRSADLDAILAKLEGDRWLDRDAPQINPQLSVARITPRGLRLIEEMEPAIATLQEYMASCLSRRDLRELSRECECIYGHDPSCGAGSDSE
jgi:DNA-binding MarR family transcriptional regulator